MRDALRPYREGLARVPLYVSIDKDVMVADDASVNWDSGHLRLSEAASVVSTFFDAAGGRLAGADLLGDWSPVRLGTRLARLCDRLDHPSPSHDSATSSERNRRANAALLRALLPDFGRSAAEESVVSIVPAEGATGTFQFAP